MKKLLQNSVAVISATLFLTACGPAVQNTTTPEVVQETESGPNVKVDRFVSVDAIADLTMGMSIQDVVSKLGSKPYNVLSAQANGHYIFHYRYKIINMEIPVDNQNDKGIEKNPVKYVYHPEIQDLYILFDGTGKLEYYITNAGQLLAEKLLRNNNLLYVIKSDKRLYDKDTSGLFRYQNADAFYPLMPCKNCQPVQVKETKEAKSNEETSSDSEQATETEKSVKKILNVLGGN